MRSHAYGSRSQEDVSAAACTRESVDIVRSDVHRARTAGYRGDGKFADGSHASGKSVHDHVTGAGATPAEMDVITSLMSALFCALRPVFDRLPLTFNNKPQKRTRSSSEFQANMMTRRVFSWLVTRRGRLASYTVPEEWVGAELAKEILGNELRLCLHGSSDGERCVKIPNLVETMFEEERDVVLRDAWNIYSQVHVYACNREEWNNV